MTLIWILIAVLVVGWCVARFALRGPDLSRYDEPRTPSAGSRSQPSPEHADVDAMVRSRGGEEQSRLPSKQRVAHMREVLESETTLNLGVFPALGESAAGGVVIHPLSFEGRVHGALAAACAKGRSPLST